MTATQGRADPLGGDDVARAPMRIAIGLAGLALGGAQINAIDLARALRERGHQVSVFAIRDAVPVSIIPYAESSKVDVELLPGGHGLWYTARSIARFAHQGQSDVVHVFAPWLGKIVGVSAAMGSAAYVETNWYMDNYFWGSPEVPLIVGTGRMREQAQARLKAAVHLMEPPVDLRADAQDSSAGRQFRTSHGIGDDEVLLTVVSRVDRSMKSEGIAHTIAALVRLRDPLLTLVIVGDGDAHAEISVQAAEANNLLRRNAIVMAGSMLDPRAAYSAADVVVGMGGSAIRALAHGKPVIVVGEKGFSLPYTPSTREHFRYEGFYGVGAGSDPVARLASHIKDLRDSDHVRQDLAQFGLVEAKERFGLDAAAASLESIYVSAIATLPRRRTRVYRGSAIVAADSARRLKRLLHRPPT